MGVKLVTSRNLADHSAPTHRPYSEFGHRSTEPNSGWLVRVCITIAANIAETAILGIRLASRQRRGIRGRSQEEPAGVHQMVYRRHQRAWKHLRRRPLRRNINPPPVLDDGDSAAHRSTNRAKSSAAVEACSPTPTASKPATAPPLGRRPDARAARQGFPRRAGTARPERRTRLRAAGAHPRRAGGAADSKAEGANCLRHECLAPQGESRHDQEPPG